MDSTETRRRLEKLTLEADTLAHAVEVLNITAAQIAKRTRRSETVIACLVLSFVLDVALTVLVYIGLTSVSDTQHAIQETQANGQVVRQKVLCPLYGLFIQSYSTKARDTYPQGPAAYEKAFATLRAGRDALHCAPTP